MTKFPGYDCYKERAVNYVWRVDQFVQHKSYHCYQESRDKTIDTLSDL